MKPRGKGKGGGGAGNPTRGLHSPVKPWHLFWGELREEGSLATASARNARVRTADRTHEREHMRVRVRTCAPRGESAVWIDASGKVPRAGRWVRVRRHRTGNGVHLLGSQPPTVILQGPVPGLVLGQNVLALAQLLAQVSHLLAEGGVLLLQERSPDGDLVLLQPPSVTGALGCHVVLSAPRPVLVILLVSDRRNKKQDIRFRQSRVSARALPGGSSPGVLTRVSFPDRLYPAERRVPGPCLPSRSKDPPVTTCSYSLSSRVCAPPGETRGW